MMQDGKALQAGTTHNFGTNFAKAFDIQFLSREGKLEYVYETSWGISTRLIGAIIMTHGDERGLRLPPRIAPIQIVIVPVAAHKGGVMEKCDEVFKQLSQAGLRVKVDDRDTVSPGFKFNDWELKGVPVRLEIGPRDIENEQAMAFRRDTCEKAPVALKNLAQSLTTLLDDIQQTLFRQAEELRDSRITVARNMQELAEAVQTGFAKTMWCGDAACEDKIKQETTATSRNMPFDQTPVGDACVCCGKKADKLIYFAKAY
jgi:prolyl-tRNA synthetase